MLTIKAIEYLNDALKLYVGDDEEVAFFGDETTEDRNVFLELGEFLVRGDDVKGKETESKWLKVGFNGFKLCVS
ncbi:hypothetical protein LIER_16046 [Lithospermum erythrorhizon]|uniref:Uncharacterized protein n=1 Tax=Lithospermum erythrorhizon TaxID=34254 RepID=A0AAV3Q8D2_LITER